MILAAGLGTRLGKLTGDRPKALVEIHGVPLLEIILKRLKKYGFEEVVINIHHHAGMIREYLEKNTPEGMKVQISEEKEKPLETGGGIRHARELLLDTPAFLVHNVDIVSDMDLGRLMSKHMESEALVTLAVSRRKTFRYLLADEEGRLCGWENVATGEKIMVRQPEGTLTQWGYSGVAALSREVLFLLPEEEVFSLTPFFLELARTHLIKVETPAMSYWYDTGKPGIIATLEDEISPEKLFS